MVNIIGIELWYDDLNNEPAVWSFTKLIPFGRYRIYLLLFIEINISRQLQGVSDMSMIYNNTLMTEKIRRII